MGIYIGKFNNNINSILNIFFVFENGYLKSIRFWVIIFIIIIYIIYRLFKKKDELEYLIERIVKK